MARALLAGLCSLVLAGGVASAATFDVDRTDDTAAAGAQACTAAANDCSLRGAIVKANATAGLDTINVPAGTYTVNLPGAGEDAAATGDLDITDSLLLAGAGAATTIIDGGQLDRVFHTDPGGTGTVSVTIKDVTIQNGQTTVISFVLANGGAVLNGSANTASSNTGGTLTLQNCIVQGSNTPRAGGGVANSGTMVLLDTTVTGNHADTLGGGVFQDDTGSMTITDSTVRDNTGGQGAGGLWSGVFSTSTDPLVTITGSTFSGNAGIGIFANRGSLNITNTTVSGNAGFGVQNSSSSANMFIHNSTVTLNGGGGLSTGPQFVATNTILAGNTTTDCSGTITTLGYNLIQTNGCTIVGNPATSILGQAANLGPLVDNGGPTTTHALLPGSPAIDAGNPAVPGSGGNACEATDQRGTTRPQPAGGRCDIGAFELVPPPTTTTSSSTTTTVTSTTSSTVTTTSTSTTSTTLLTPEVCGDCLDNDGNGLTDFEDPACCSGAQLATLTLKKGLIKPGTGSVKLALSGLLSKAGLATGTTATQDVFVQLHASTGEVLCAKLPASALKRKKTKLLFKDAAHAVTSAHGVDKAVLVQKKSGAGKVVAGGKQVTLTPPAAGAVDVLVGLRDPVAGDTSNVCAKGTATFKAKPKGVLKFP